MKICKKLLSLLLCILLLTSLVVLPVYADESTPAEDPIIQKQIDMLDLDAMELGDFEEYSPGVTEFKYNNRTQYNGSKEVVTTEDGGRGLKLDLSTAEFKNITSKSERLIEGGYSLIFAIKLAVPDGFQQYVESIQFTLDKQTDAVIPYNLGLTDGSDYSKINDVGKSFKTSETGKKTIIYTRNQLKKVPLWQSGSYDGGFKNRTAWDDSFTSLFFVMSASLPEGKVTGYVTIEDISMTVSAPQSVWDNYPVIEKISVWDFEDEELGTMTDLSAYPFGIREFEAKGETQFNGTKSIVENDSGKKVLELDLGSTTFTRGTSNTDKLFQGSYSPIYSIKISSIPRTYTKYITNITVKFDKQTEAYIPYNFGVTDGTNWSKQNENGVVMKTDASGPITVSYDPTSDLYRVSDMWSAGSWSNVSNTPKWDDSYTDLFLWLSAYIPEGTDPGKLLIEDITYTISATESQLAEADAEWEKIKGFVTGFEADGTESDKAVSGEKVKVINSGNGYSGGKFSIDSNPNIAEASGLSFWVYNPMDVEMDPKIILNAGDGEKYIYNTGYKIPAKTYKKVIIDFADLYEYAEDEFGAGGHGKGPEVSLTGEQIAALSSVSFMIRKAKMDMYVDDVYLLFGDISQTSESDIVISSETVTGATVNEEGKIVIPASSEAQVVEISIPAGTLTNAKSLTYNITSNATASAQLKFYTDVVTDAGKSGYIKQGEQPWNYSIEAGTVLNHELDFLSGNSGGASAVRAFDGGWYINNYMSWRDTPNPTASERATATKLYIAVNAFGTPAAEGAPVTDYITLDSINLLEEGVKITAVQAESGGSVTVVDGSVFAGNMGEFLVTPEAGFFLQTLTVTDSLGNNVPVSKDTSTGAENLGYYYTFTVPAADVTITPTFIAIERTLPYEAAVNGNNFRLDFTIPYVDGMAFNENTYEFEPLEGYGLFIAPADALEKYGLVPEDLTVEFVEELKADGHHLADYIYRLDSEDIILSTSNVNFTKFTVEITNLSAEARRSGMTLVTYAEFSADGSGTVYFPEQKSVDAFIYGDFLMEEFYAGKGINYSGAMQSIATVDEDDPIFDLATWEDIYYQGFDHVRLPVNLSSSLDSEGKLIEEHMVKLDKAVTNAISTGFSLVLDLHTLGNISGDFAGTKDLYYSVWEQLAERYAGLPLSVAFQIISEPNTELQVSEDNPDPMTNAELMELQENIIDIIRAVPGNENRTVVIGTDNNGGWNLGSFTDTILDKGNIIVDIHYYDPMSFTHSGAYGDNPDYPAGATDYDPASIEAAMASYAAFAEENGVTVWIGEWGAYKPDVAAKVNYYSDVSAAANNNGLAWCLWEYGGDWSPYTAENGWDADILAAIGLG